MSCPSGQRLFRLLDARVGWDEATVAGLEGLDRESGISLARLSPGDVDEAGLLDRMPPPRIARACEPCAWYLVTPAPPQSRLMRWDACTLEWRPMHPSFANPLLDAVAIAVWRDSIAVADAGANKVGVFDRAGERIAAEIRLPYSPGPVAFTGDGDVLVANAAGGAIAWFSHGGGALGPWPVIPPASPVRMIWGGDCALWIAVQQGESFAIWRSARGAEFEPATINGLVKVTRSSGVAAANEYGFCIAASNKTLCFTWQGRTPESGLVVPPAPPALAKSGELFTLAIDSGVPRCRWHRVEAVADVPDGTTLAIDIATSEETAFVPHPLDWQAEEPFVRDYLVQRPPGRYLFLRVRMTGDGAATPLLRQIQIHFPRVTSLDRLPAVYRENREAEDFSERFLALFDAQMDELDRAIERAPALLDPQNAAADALPWIAGWLDMVFEPDWSEAQRREILKVLPSLFRRRGTPEGLLTAIRLVFGVDAVLSETALAATWGAVAPKSKGGLPIGTLARLNSTRLFARSRARFQLGSSALSRAPVCSYGNPDLDPHSSTAWRFRVMTPPEGEYGPVDPGALARLVNAQKPAHTLATSVRIGRTFILGSDIALGIDTRFGSLSRRVLGSNGSVRLSRDTILWPSSRGPLPAIIAGAPSTIGISTRLE